MPLGTYPDGQPKSFSNQYSNNSITATSTVASGSTGFLTNTLDFKFGSGLIKAIIDGGGPAYVQFNGQAATTNDYKLSSADLLTDWYTVGIPISGVSIGATSTSLAMRIGAWG